MNKLLFFDDFLAYRNDNTTRVFFQPDWLQDKAMTSNGVGGFCQGNSVVPAPDGGYYLYYNTTMPMAQRLDEDLALCVAWSENGLRFEPVKEVENIRGLPGSIGFGTDYVPAVSGIFFDKTEKDPVKRYKSLCARFGDLPDKTLLSEAPVMLVSPDGLHWNKLNDVPVLPSFVDCNTSLSYNPLTGNYQVLSRRRWGERKIYMTQSSDLEKWSQPCSVLHPLPQDPPTTHFYGMPHFFLPDSDIFLGFLWNMTMPYHSIMDGPVFSEYVYSYDGLSWNRTNAGLMERGARGCVTGGSSYCFGMLQKGDEMLVYANAFEKEHGTTDKKEMNFKAPRGERIVPGIVKRDRWVGLTSYRGLGEITTVALKFANFDFSLNLNAPYGCVRIQLTDVKDTPLPGFTYEDCAEIMGDHLDYIPNWRGGSIREAMKLNEWIKVQISFLEAEIFAINGDYSFMFNRRAPEYDRL